MHPRVAEAIDYIEAKRADLVASFAGASPERLKVRPRPSEWSAAEVIDHLRIVESGIARLLAKRIAQARDAGLRAEDSTGSILGSLDYMGETLDHGKIEAPVAVTPPLEVNVDAAISGLTVTRKALLDALAIGDGLALGDIKHTHPLLGELDLYQWLLFVGRHEARHTRQITRVLASQGP
jgi:hypothetical protein